MGWSSGPGFVHHGRRNIPSLAFDVLFLIVFFSSSTISAFPMSPSASPGGVPTNNDILAEGSPDYNLLVHQQRNWSSSSSTGNLFGGTNMTVPLTTSRTVNGTFLRGCFPRPLSLNSSSLHLQQALPFCNDTARDKHIRLQWIQEHVLSTIGRGKVPATLPSSIPMSPGVVGPSSGPNAAVVPQSTKFSGEIKSFIANCDVPSRVDEDVWTDPTYFHLYFQLSPSTPKLESQRNVSAAEGASTTPSPGTTSTAATPAAKKRYRTVSAKLRLYKMAGTPSATADLLPVSEACNETSEAIKVPKKLVLSSSDTSLTTLEDVNPSPAIVVEEKVRVSIYWYKAPITKSHYKKRLLDTKMVTVKESKWIEFDILNAVSHWLDRSDKNFGLAVEVENEDNDLVNPHLYFSNLACPGRNISSNESIVSQLAPPQIEVCILSTPSSSSAQRDVEVSTEAPFPFLYAQMSDSFRHLSGVARAHEEKRRQNTTTEHRELQNDAGIVSSPTTEHHRHRHGHGNNKRNHAHRHHHDGQQGNNKAPSTSTSTPGFQLDEDHPLRRILANVASNVRGSSSSRRHHHRQNQDSGSTSSSSSSSSGSVETYGDRDDIIIQKIYIQAPEGTSSSLTQAQEQNEVVRER